MARLNSKPPDQILKTMQWSPKASLLLEALEPGRLFFHFQLKTGNADQ